MSEEGLGVEAKAVLKYIRVAPRKARMAVDLIRGKNAEEAMTILKFTPRRAARVVQRVLKSAVANAMQKDMGDVDALRVAKVFVDVGPTMKRILPRAMGRANTIRKRTSHITVVIDAEPDQAKKDRRPLAKEKKALKTKMKEKKTPQEPAKNKVEEKPEAKAKDAAKAEAEKKDQKVPAVKEGGEE